MINADGNVMGLMPHPEHAVDPLVGSTDGALVLRLGRGRGPRAHGCSRLEAQRLLQSGVLSERLAQLLDVTRAERDGAAPRRPVGRVREPDEPLARELLSRSCTTEAKRLSPARC